MWEVKYKIIYFTRPDSTTTVLHRYNLIHTFPHTERGILNSVRIQEGMMPLLVRSLF